MNPPVNGKIPGLFKAYECFSSTFQGKFNFQGLFKTVLYIQVLFKPVPTLMLIEAPLDSYACMFKEWLYAFVISTIIPWAGPYGPRLDKTHLWGLRQSKIHTSLLSYRDQLEHWNLACSKFIYNTFQLANNKGADQTAKIRGCTGWSAPLLFANPDDRFSRIVAHIGIYHKWGWDRQIGPEDHPLTSQGLPSADKKRWSRDRFFYPILTQIMDSFSCSPLIAAFSIF